MHRIPFAWDPLRCFEDLGNHVICCGCFKLPKVPWCHYEWWASKRTWPEPSAEPMEYCEDESQQCKQAEGYNKNNLGFFIFLEESQTDLVCSNSRGPTKYWEEILYDTLGYISAVWCFCIWCNIHIFWKLNSRFSLAFNYN